MIDDTEPRPSPPTPIDDPSSRFFWEGTRSHRLLILRCEECGRFIHWPRPICRFCLSTELAPNEVSGQATLYTYTVAAKAFHPWFVDRVPYVIASVELVEQPGLKLVTNLVECALDAIRIGMPLEVVFEDVTDTITLPMFRPADARSAAVAGARE